VEYVAFHGKQGTFDIGFGKLLTLRDFISLLERDIFKEKARIVPKDIRECVVNRSAKHMLLETKLLTDIRQGLLETLEFYRRNENVIAKLLSSQSV
jgi:nucleoside-diphosphate-sugar epimerase